jgi:ribulose-phosphate 3-epimerase
MSVIVPAILPSSRADLEDKLAALLGLASSVQIDMIDGKFLKTATWPYLSREDRFADDEMFPYLDQLHYEMDLMVTSPEEVAGTWIAAGAERVTLHVESTNYLSKTVRDLEIRYGHSKGFAPDLISLGLAININSDSALLEPYLDHADYVQFMGIATIGKQGEPFDKKVLRKIAAFKRRYPQMTIQVDGGVSLITAPELLTAGVDRLIVGSALWRAPNLAAELDKFHQLVQEYGIYS